MELAYARHEFQITEVADQLAGLLAAAFQLAEQPYLDAKPILAVLEAAQEKAAEIKARSAPV